MVTDANAVRCQKERFGGTVSEEEETEQDDSVCDPRPQVVCVFKRVVLVADSSDGDAEHII